MRQGWPAGLVFVADEVGRKRMLDEILSQSAATASSDRLELMGSPGRPLPVWSSSVILGANTSRILPRPAHVNTWAAEVLKEVVKNPNRCELS